MEVRSARYICAGEISSRGPSKELQGSQPIIARFLFPEVFLFFPQKYFLS